MWQSIKNLAIDIWGMVQVRWFIYGAISMGVIIWIIKCAG